MKKVDFNGYSFSDPKVRAKMKYVVITSGDLDLNNAYAFTNRKEALEYMEDTDSYRRGQAVFEIKDITPPITKHK